MKRWMQNLFIKSIRRAIDDYHMIGQGDRILVGVSGGKDSSLLFYTLTLLSKYGPYDFEVTGLTVDHGLIGNIDAYTQYCKNEGLALQIHEEHYATKLTLDGEFTPCYTCSRLRKGIIKRYALENGFNKIALGHTKDDLVETFVMNILQHGKIATMPPVSSVADDLSMIRPLMYMDEVSIIKATEALKMPLMKDICEFSHNRLRSQSENLIHQIELTAPDFSDKVIQALGNVDLNRLL
jgi:tRNA(Ile)-lysidine synthase TilS/MesJ